MPRSATLVFCLAVISRVAGADAAATADGASVNRGYIFTAPKRLIAGEKENVCLSLHNLEPPVHVNVDLLAPSSSAGGVTASSNADREDDILASVQTTLKNGIETCLELRVTANTKYSVANLRLRLKFDKHPDYVVDVQKKIFVEHDALVTFVETDKAIYKPGQDVNIRVLNLKHNLKPWIKPIPRVWIENPSEVRVAQWTNVSTENGMAQLSFPLSAEPSSGTWRIKVEKTRPQLIHTSSFEVRKYVLPRFQVTIGAPSYILADAKDVTWKICARYSYGEPVKGTLLLSLRPQTSVWKRKQTIGEINYEEKMNGTSDGCVNYTVSAQVLGLPHWKVAPNNVVLLANFTESKSGLIETATSRTLVVHHPLKLEFAPHTPKYFKPGLPYHGKLRVLRADASSPAPNEKIQVCLKVRRKDEWQRSVVECRNFTSSNADGFLDFIVPPQHKSIVLLSFVATAVEYPTKYYSPEKRWRVFVDQPSAYMDVEPWYSASSSYLLVTRGYQPVTCGEKYSFNVMYTSPGLEDAKPISFHYSINSKGDMLVFGHVKYKPRKDALFDYSEFRNVLGASRAQSVSDQSSNDQHIVHRFPLSVKITASMAPLSELLLYYVRPDGEVVSASLSVEVGQCFENPVKLTWHEETQRPGTSALLHLEAAPGSLCGVSAVDKSTRFLRPSAPSAGAESSSAEPHLLEPESVFGRLKRFHLPAETMPLQSSWLHCNHNSQSSEESGGDLEDEQEEFDHLPRPVAAAARQKRHSVTYNVAANYVDAIQAFDDFGAVVMSDLILETRPCPPWRSSSGRSGLGPMSQEEIDEPDRMLKAVKAMPLAFQFSAPGSTLAESTVTAQDAIDPAAFELQTSTIVRSYFPETWIWELIPTGIQGRATLERKLPDTITDWIGKAVCISGKQGLGIGMPTQITAFQPFFLDYSMPYSVRRGEQLHLKVSLFNYMTHSLPVIIKLLNHEGLDLGFNRSSETIFCVQPKDSVVHEFLLLPRELGELNVSVAAEIDVNRENMQTCGPKNLSYTRDEIIKPVLVKAEGFPVDISYSAFLCPKDFSDDSSLVWELELPKFEKTGEQVVEGSVKAHVSLIGDVLGPALDNLEQLVRLPMGCGEQNMILFVPNIHAIAYLDAINRHAATEMRDKALNNMRKGYQRELNYRHPDGSYSAFGPADEGGSGSMWLTAFVVKSFAQARGMIQIDERDLKISAKWIMRRQLENGCFPVVGQIFHKDMKGGLREEDGSSSALTAYVLIALLESGVPLSASLVNNALHCLDKASASSDDFAAENPYSAALATYALALLEHPRANESLQALMTRASRQRDLLWWEDKGRPSTLSLSVEMTAYGVLSLLKLGGEANRMEALRAVRWLSRKRNAEGGFSSTQDTILGLEALTKYALAMANASATDLSVLVTATDLERLYKIDEERRMVLERIELPSLPTSLEIFAEGEGCLLVQSSLRYNKARASGSEAFELSASTESLSVRSSSPEESPSNDQCSMQRLTICSRYKLADEESNMALLEIGMVTGFAPDRSSLHDLLDEHATGVKRFEENEDTVVIYFDKLTSQKTCISFQAIRENVVDNAEPGNIKLYDYYQQELTISTNYKFADVCDKKNETEEVAHKASESSPRKMLQESEEQLNNQLSVDLVDPVIEKVSREKKVDPSVFSHRFFSSSVPPTTTDQTVKEGSGAEVESDSQGLFSPKPILPNLDMDVVDEGFSPVFVNVDHELETPNGIEGPVPVYVPAPILTTTGNVNASLISQTTYATLINSSSKTETQTNTTNSKNHNSQCPRCESQLPADLRQLFCNSSSAVKVAVRRSRKVRLLLDLSPETALKRLRATVELYLEPECTCAPLDTPGSMALILSLKGGRNFSKATDKTKTLLDNTHAMFILPLVVGEPHQIQEARLACARSL